MSWVPTARVFDFWVNETRSVHWSIKIATDGIKTDGKKKKKERKQPEQKKMGADPHNLAVYYVRTESAAFFFGIVFFLLGFFFTNLATFNKKNCGKKRNKTKTRNLGRFFFCSSMAFVFFSYLFFFVKMILPGYTGFSFQNVYKGYWFLPSFCFKVDLIFY